MTRALHTLTTTAHTASGLVPICHCGWTPRHVVETQDEVTLLVVEHNEGFVLDACPDCGARLSPHEAKWTVKTGSRHYTDRVCFDCGWRASLSPA